MDDLLNTSPSVSDFMNIGKDRILFEGYGDHPHKLSKMNMIIAAVIVAFVLVLVIVSISVSARGSDTSGDHGGFGSSD